MLKCPEEEEARGKRARAGAAPRRRRRRGAATPQPESDQASLARPMAEKTSRQQEKTKTEKKQERKEEESPTLLAPLGGSLDPEPSTHRQGEAISLYILPPPDPLHLMWPLVIILLYNTNLGARATQAFWSAIQAKCSS